MICEVVAVGTELLLGQIVDTNSSWIGDRLAFAGVDCHHQVKVGDNLDRLAGSIRLALSRADAVICCGGLGPTHDDLTRDAVAAVMGVALERDEEIVERLLDYFASRGRPMPPSNLRQADRPVGAEWIPVQPGTAAGLVCPVGDKVVYAVPGVPWEMREMVTGFVLPDLVRRSGAVAVIRSKTLRTWGLSESALADQLAERIRNLDEVGNPTIAFLASGGEGIKVRITAKAGSEEEAFELIAAEEAQIREVVGDIVFGSDDETMESVVLDLLSERGLSLGIAESLTGGLVSSRIVETPGASDVLRGAVVSYASEVKWDLLDVPEGPVVTVEAAAAMARGVRKVLDADVGIATTGVAGPEPQEDRPPGTVCLAVALGDTDDDVSAVELRLPGNRTVVRELTVISVLDLLRKKLLER